MQYHNDLRRAPLLFSARNKRTPVSEKISEKALTVLFVAKLSKFFFPPPVNGQITANEPYVVIRKLST